MPLDQVEKTTSNCFPRFRWELGNLDKCSENFAVYTLPRYDYLHCTRMLLGYEVTLILTNTVTLVHVGYYKN